MGIDGIEEFKSFALNDFKDFVHIKDLPTGDQRVVHDIGIHQSQENLYSNESLVYIECNDVLFASKTFSRLTEPKEIEAWIKEVSEEHLKDCPLSRPD